MCSGCLPPSLPPFQVSLSGSVSSQYLTALLMAAPLATGSGELLCMLCLLRLHAACCAIAPARCAIHACCAMHAGSLGMSLLCTPSCIRLLHCLHPVSANDSKHH